MNTFPSAQTQHFLLLSLVVVNKTQTQHFLLLSLVVVKTQPVSRFLWNNFFDPVWQPIWPGGYLELPTLLSHPTMKTPACLIPRDYSSGTRNQCIHPSYYYQHDWVVVIVDWPSHTTLEQWVIALTPAVAVTVSTDTTPTHLPTLSWLKTQEGTTTL